MRANAGGFHRRKSKMRSLAHVRQPHSIRDRWRRILPAAPRKRERIRPAVSDDREPLGHWRKFSGSLHRLVCRFITARDFSHSTGSRFRIADSRGIQSRGWPHVHPEVHRPSYTFPARWLAAASCVCLTRGQNRSRRRDTARLRDRGGQKRRSTLGSRGCHARIPGASRICRGRISARDAAVHRLHIHRGAA